MQLPEERVNILLVDDHPENLLALEAILGDLGQNLVKARSGKEALRYMLDADFAVIVLDVEMPDMDGLETAALIRARERSRHTPIIFLTAIGKDEEQIFRGYAVGAVDYLLKPFVPEVLRSKAAAFVELFRKTQELTRSEAIQRRLNETLTQQGKLVSESETRLRAVLTNVLDGIVTINAHGLIESFNPAAERIFGYTAGEVIGQDMKILMPEHSLDEPNECVSHRYEVTGKRKDGSIFPIEIGVSAMEMVGQRLFIGIVRDLTERKQLERLKNDFVATVSHELRTPLTSLRGFAELILHQDLPPETQREFVTIIHTEALRLTTLINNFLDLQRMESGRQLYHFEPTDLVPLVHDVAAVFTPEERICPLRLDVPDSLPLAQVDADRLRQVLTNFLSNAVKFSPQGGEVRVGARPEGAEIVLWVADQGVGIPPEAIPQLFTKFFRVESQETRSIGGTGLGLALVKEIIEAHEGRVWVESSLGQGSTFFFTVPVTEPALLAMPAPEVETERTAEIILVEDDQAYAQLLCTHLTGAGFAVTTTRSAEQALELVHRAPPRVLLVDIHLEGALDGWDLIVACKSDPLLHTMPLLLISTSEETNTRGLALAGADYLLKPVSAAGLREAIRHRLPVRAGTRVLVVDDDAGFRHHVTAALATEEDIEVTEAATGQEALACVAEHIPDLVLLDLLMPELDGFAVLRRLRADKRAMNLPVLVMTGKDLLPREKAFLQRRLASLVSKKEATLDYFTQVVAQIGTSVRSAPALAVSLHEADTIVLS